MSVSLAGWDSREHECCRLCGRILAVEADPMSANAGGDCWGCIGKIESDGGWALFVGFVQDEINKGWRHPDGSPKPASAFMFPKETEPVGD